MKEPTMSRMMFPGRLSTLSALLFCAHVSWSAVTVSNVAVAQREGTKIVDITYDVAADVATVTVSVVVKDAGTDIGATSFSGDVGAVTPGIGKHIEWDAGADWDGQWSDHMQVEVTADDSAIGDEFVLIPAGTNIGTNPLAEGESYHGWYPETYSLTVSAFYMSKYEESKAKWDEVRAWAANHGYTDLPAGGGKGPTHPVQEVNWYDVVKWCNARSEMEGRIPCYTVSGAAYRTGQWDDVSCNFSVLGYRLPTDTEWEYAARGGLSGKRFPWGDTITHEQANYYSYWTGGHPYFSYDHATSSLYHPAYNDGTNPYTSSVGSFAANGYGLYDMAGNVWEWCWDCYPRWEGSSRVDRGGSWRRGANYCSAGYRDWHDPDCRSYCFGFRVCFAAP